ncbi:MAG TPA: hypothetical protein VG297_24395 [Bryobacteraceae bacterium]|nr:hypothetical protein [Bryobacteraceae bacterium]
MQSAPSNAAAPSSTGYDLRSDADSPANGQGQTIAGTKTTDKV